MGEVEKSFSKTAKVNLTENNFQRLNKLLMEHLCRKLEFILIEKKFTIRGALHLAEEIRQLINFFNKYHIRGVREVFSRLRDITSFLHIQNLYEEIPNRLRDSKLETNFIRKILKLRIDFKEENVN